MTANIHALDRPLCMGDQEQIAVIKALEAGEQACEECGTLYLLDEKNYRYDCGHTKLCKSCIEPHLCKLCNDFVQDIDDLVYGGGLCPDCLEDEKEYA